MIHPADQVIAFVEEGKPDLAIKLAHVYVKYGTYIAASGRRRSAVVGIKWRAALKSIGPAMKERGLL